jgi:large subunit ribosomal protein L1
MKHGKRYRDDVKKFDRAKSYPVAEAVKLLKTFKPIKFDQTVELAIHLNIDPKDSAQTLRGSIGLPRGIGRTRSVVVFADGDDVEKARAAGADAVGLEDLAEKVQGGWADFDVAIATPRTMKVVSRLGKVLGPQGKMPTPKTGTVADDVAKAVREFKAGKVEYRNDATGNLHVPVGRLSFSEADLAENIQALLAHVRSLRPSTVKGGYIKKVSLSATMTPGILLAEAAS